MDANELINSNAGTMGCFPMGSVLVLKYYALEALEMQKKEDEQVFRGFLLSIIPRLMAGECIDIEAELKKVYYESE